MHYKRTRIWLICLCFILYSRVWHNVSNNGTPQILQPPNTLCCFGNNGPEKLDFILLLSLFPLTCRIKKITAILAIKSGISSVWKQRPYVAKVVGLVSRERSFF